MENKPVKILVVDDEPLLQELILQFFKKQVNEKLWSFSFAENGLKALDKLQEDSDISIILTDILMPEMDGLTLLDRLSKKDSHYFPIVISAYGDMQNIRTAMNLGAIDFIIKPIDRDDLEKTLIKIIQQNDLYQQALKIKKRYIEINHELEIAKEMQMSLIPNDFKKFSDKVEIYGNVIPAAEVGGDFFDIVSIDENHLAFIVGDVAGKGIPGAFFMTRALTLLKAMIIKSQSLEECLASVSDLLSENNHGMVFVTCFCSILDLQTGVLTYCNAGHNPSFIISKSGDIKTIGKYEGVALGIKNKNFTGNYQQKQIQLDKEDLICMYTDGIIEASREKEDGENELFNENRLLNYFKTNTDKNVKDIIEGLTSDVRNFSSNASLRDDLTIFAVRYL